MKSQYHCSREALYLQSMGHFWMLHLLPWHTTCQQRLQLGSFRAAHWVASKILPSHGTPSPISFFT